MTNDWVIHAPSVHMGGGRTLLLSLLASLGDNFRGHAFLDARLKVDRSLPPGLRIDRVSPTLAQRFLAEIRLRRLAPTSRGVLCFGNLPPLFRLDTPVSVFLQNRYLVEPISSRGFPLTSRMRIAMERVWVSSLQSHANAFIVQTASMASALRARLGDQIPVYVVPLIGHDMPSSDTLSPTSQDRSKETAEFVYVASGEPHKNHRRLIDAWCLLAREDIRPRLYLTVSDRDWPALCGWIDEMTYSHSLDLQNLGLIHPQEIAALYSRGCALIYPSTVESFGIPLLEARLAGAPVLAAELDYVRDVVDPNESFLPTSALSIARAVKRFLAIREARPQLAEPRGFLDILERMPELAPRLGPERPAIN